MRLTTDYLGGETPFEGDRTLFWRSLPANARVTKASVKLTPAQSATGELFEEIITFTNGQGDWGATKITDTDFVEVDFHKRRTLARVGTGAVGANLQVDVGGGLYVEINDKGAIRAPGDTLFKVPADGKLPGLVVTKFKLTASTKPDISQITIRSVPTNVSVRLGNLPSFWTHLGELTGEDASPDFADVLQAFLVDAKAENGYFNVPLILHSDTIARLQLTLEIEYQIEASVMPPGLDEVQLPYDFGSLPKAQEHVLQLAVPPNMHVAPNGVTARVRGAFEETRIVFGPTGVVTPSGTVDISPAVSQAQMISLPETLKAAAVDLYMVVTQAVKLQLDLREDLDGKPGSLSLLPGPVRFELAAPVGTAQDRKTVGEVRWLSVVLPAIFQFQEDQRYWLVLQCLEGQTAWNATPAGAGSVGMQHTKDGGLSWRETVATGVAGPVSTFFRLRQKPERFEPPIELQVGSGEQAIRVSLDRFQPLGRVDFALDFDEVAEAFNQYLATAAPAACPETEHLANGDFEQWLRVGDNLMPARTIDLGVPPTAVAVAPDGSWAYVGLVPDEGAGSLQVIDVACNERIKEIDLDGLSQTALVISPDGTRAYVAGSQQLQVIDTSTHRALGDPLNLHAEIKALALSPDGGRLYVAESAALAGTATAVSRILAIDTALLEQVIRGQLTLDQTIAATIPLEQGQEPTALAVSPEGSHLYITIVKDDATKSEEVRIFDATTLQPTGEAIPVGREPSAIALSADGKVAVVANKGSDNISVIDTVRRTLAGLPIAVGTKPIAVAISPDGGRAYVANSGSDALNLNVIDLSRRAAEPFNIGAPQTALALTPQGDRIYVITTDGDNNSLASIQIGTRLPAEWNLTSGWVTPICLPDPFHLVAVLGQPRETEKERKAVAMPTALSQTVLVVESCPYEFSFWGIAKEPDAVAEVMWLSKDCGLLRTDQVPIEVLERQTKAAASLVFTQASISVAQRPVLRLHRVRLMAPAGAEQAEVRFNVPEGVTAGIDRVSLMATNEAVANADLSVQQEGQLAEWDLLSTAASGVTLLAVEGGMQLRNAGAETAELIQVIPVKGDQPFNLEFRGRAVTQPSAKDNPHIELRWLKSDQSAAGAPVILEITPIGLDSMLAGGASPTDASEAELHLVVPPGTSLEIKRVSLKFSAATSVPVTFIAQAPGELTVSNWRVALEQVEAAAPRIPEKGLCAPTPPGRQPGETRNDCCFCPCCESEQTMTETTLMETRSGRPALVGHCATCGTELVRFSGPRVSGAPPFYLRPIAARRPIVITTRAATAARGRFNAGAAIVTSLTAIPGIGEARARRLAEAGIDSVEKLATAAPEDVAQALRRAGVAAQYAARFIEEARRLLSSRKETG